MSEWISVDDRLPGIDVEVLCYARLDDCNSIKAQFLAERKGDAWYETWGVDNIADVGWAVTHWQPLPEPPE